QRLNRGPGLAAVWARTQPVLPGPVGSSTTFHTLPSPLPVLSAFHPAGTLPTSVLRNGKPRALSSATSKEPPSRTAKAARVLTRRIVYPPSDQRTRETTTVSAASPPVRVAIPVGFFGQDPVRVLPRPGSQSARAAAACCCRYCGRAGRGRERAAGLKRIN